MLRAFLEGNWIWDPGASDGERCGIVHPVAAGPGPEGFVRRILGRELGL